MIKRDTGDKYKELFESKCKPTYVSDIIVWGDDYTFGEDTFFQNMMTGKRSNCLDDVLRYRSRNIFIALYGARNKESGYYVEYNEKFDAVVAYEYTFLMKDPKEGEKRQWEGGSAWYVFTRDGDCYTNPKDRTCSFYLGSYDIIDISAEYFIFKQEDGDNVLNDAEYDTIDRIFESRGYNLLSVCSHTIDTMKKIYGNGVPHSLQESSLLSAMSNYPFPKFVNLKGPGKKEVNKAKVYTSYELQPIKEEILNRTKKFFAVKDYTSRKWNAWELQNRVYRFGCVQRVTEDMCVIRLFMSCIYVKDFVTNIDNEELDTYEDVRIYIKGSEQPVFCKNYFGTWYTEDMRYFYVESVLFPWEPEDSRGTSLTNLDEFAYEFNPDYASDDYAEACELGKTIINSISNPYMNSVFSSNLDNTKHFIVKMMQIFHFDMDVVMWRMFGISFYTSGWNKNLLKDADLPKHMFVTLDELYGKILKRLENESHAKTRAESVMSMFKNIKEIFGERPDYLRNMNAEQFKVLVDTLYSLISTIPENFDVTYDDDRFDKILRGLVKIRGPKNVLSYLEFVFKDLTSIVQRFGSAGKTSMIYTYYQDYISMVAQLDGTENRMSHPEYKFKTAEEIIRAHDNVLVVYNLTKNEKDYKDKQEKFEKIWTDEKKERYQYSDTTFSVLVPKDVLEIAMEGDTLHHCVKSYINKVIEDQTNILFVRKTAELTKPFFTLEIRCEEVRQCHGFGNSNVETEAGLEEFLQDYCKAKQFKYLDPDRVLAAG